jgi:hypothetical protein
LKQGLEGLVETPDGTKARREGDLRHGQMRFLDQLLGEKHPPRLRHRNRRCAKMLLEQSS